MQRVPLFPREVTGNVPLITMTGCSELRVEQHQGLSACGTQEIRLRTSIGEVTVTGEQLGLCQYDAQEAVVAGRIRAVNLGEQQV